MLSRLFRRRPKLNNPAAILDHHIEQKKEASAAHRAWQQEQEQLTRRVFATCIKPQLDAFNGRGIEILCEPKWCMKDDVLRCPFIVRDFGREVAKFRAYITAPGRGGPKLNISFMEEVAECLVKIEYDLDRPKEVNAFMHTLAERTLSRITLHD